MVVRGGRFVSTGQKTCQDTEKISPIHMARPTTVQHCVLTLRLPFSPGFFCRGIPSPRMILTVPGVTCGSEKLFVLCVDDGVVSTTVSCRVLGD